jgi:hypothetical protein
VSRILPFATVNAGATENPMRYEHWFLSAFIMALSFGAVAQQQPAPFSPPVKDTTFETTAGNLTVESIEGFDVRFQKSRGGFVTLHALLMEQEGGDKSYSRSAVEGLWPLQVGKDETINYSTSGGGTAIRWRIPRVETVTVPAGTFETYVIERAENSHTYDYQATETSWYSPRVGYFVKFKQDLVTGTKFKEPWELVSVRAPGGALINLSGRMVTPENQALFCRERGTTLRLADGRSLTVDCATYVRTELLAYQNWLAR